MPQSREIEVHLQEGFDGESVEITLDGVAKARITARTRHQIGLAHVERLRAGTGQRIAVTIPAEGLSAALDLPQGAEVVVANRSGGTLRLAVPETPPRYA